MPAKKMSDVAKPGTTPASNTSKPVIIGHKPMVADPMVNDDNADSKPVAIPVSKPSAAGVKIAPVSAEFTKDKADEKPDPESKTEDDTTADMAVDRNSAAESSTSDYDATDGNDDGLEDDSKDNQKAELKNEGDEIVEDERQVKLKELIANKKYNVKFSDPKKASAKTFFVTVFAVLLLGALVLLLLDDAGKIDLGLQLPFDLIK